VDEGQVYRSSRPRSPISPHIPHFDRHHKALSRDLGPFLSGHRHSPFNFPDTHTEDAIMHEQLQHF
jgi:hypothetical protein